MAVVVRTQEQFFAFVKVFIFLTSLLRALFVSMIFVTAEKCFLCQGAPETIQDRLVDIPSSYVGTYKKYTRQGARVLALAFKPLHEMTVSSAPLFSHANPLGVNHMFC